MTRTVFGCFHSAGGWTFGMLESPDFAPSIFHIEMPEGVDGCSNQNQALIHRLGVITFVMRNHERQVFCHQCEAHDCISIYSDLLFSIFSIFLKSLQ